MAIVKEKLWTWFDGFNDDKLYVLKRSDVIRKYLEYDIPDISEFAATYTYDYHEIRGTLNDLQSKEKMYEEVYKMMRDIKERERL